MNPQTFHRASTSRASSSRPPRELPTMIQNGTLWSSSFLSSRTICRHNNNYTINTIIYLDIGYHSKLSINSSTTDCNTYLYQQMAVNVYSKLF